MLWARAARMTAWQSAGVRVPLGVVGEDDGGHLGDEFEDAVEEALVFDGGDGGRGTRCRDGGAAGRGRRCGSWRRWDGSR